MNGINTSFTPPLKPSYVYRDAVRKYCVQYRGPCDVTQERPAAFQMYLVKTYQEYTQQCMLQDQQNMAEQQQQSYRQGGAILALGLLAYGEIDVINEIFAVLVASSQQRSTSHIPRFIANGVRALLPLPNDTDPLTDLTTTKAWIDTYSSAFTWDADLGKFVLVSDYGDWKHASQT